MRTPMHLALTKEDLDLHVGTGQGEGLLPQCPVG